jgi:hypothetical protein
VTQNRDQHRPRHHQAPESHDEPGHQAQPWHDGGPGHEAEPRPQQPGAPALPPELAAVLAEVVPAGGAFRHRQHIHLAFLAVQRHGAARAADVVATWITHIAAYERAPQKFNATVTRAWTEMVAHHVTSGPPGADFAAFAGSNPGLFDKRLLARHYSARLLASPAARTGWVEPDLAGFPWGQIAR